MNVLLLSMPDSFEHMPPVAIRMPNGALTSLAGNVDPASRARVCVNPEARTGESDSPVLEESTQRGDNGSRQPEEPWWEPVQF
jgi:hypothetical protein